MKLRLKEDPREWRKFAWMCAGALAALALVLRWRQALTTVSGTSLAAVSAAMILLGWKRPRWFRGGYRGSMRLSHGIGEVMGPALLAVFFFCAVVPLGLVVRWTGRDSLRLRRDRAARSYWHPARGDNDLERMF